MIASHWFRRFIIVMGIMVLGVGLVWLVEYLAMSSKHHTLFQAGGAVVFLLGFYASGPRCARFLAPVPSQDVDLNQKLTSAMAFMSRSGPVYLYDHPYPQANAVGLFKFQSRIYLTSALVASLSEAGLRGVVAHENAHVNQGHILVTFCFASCFVTFNTLVSSYLGFALSLLSFLALRRYMEYRADAEAGRNVGVAVMLTALTELAFVSPGKTWHRWLCILTAYPTLPMRITAVRTGRMAHI